MAQGGGPSLAELKRQLDSLTRDLFNIDLQIQQVKEGKANPNSVERLEQARSQIKDDILQKEIQFELKKAQNKRRR